MQTSSDKNNGQTSSMRTIAMPDRLAKDWIARCNIQDFAAGSDLKLDFSQTKSIDSAGVSFLSLLRRRFQHADKKLEIINVSSAIGQTIESWIKQISTPVDFEKKGKEGLLVRLGDTAVAFWQELVKALSVLTEMVYWGTIGCLYRRDFRRGVLGEQMYQLGFRAVGIVGLLAFLIGVVLALQTAIQLKQFGADVFLAPMIGISMLRELGPLMTAIILAGRTGSATTAEIATMGVQEELDALRTMSLNPIQFVVVPKFWAITLTMPMLSILSVAAGIFGGFLVAVFYLDTSSNFYWSELAKNVFMRDFMAGFIKSIVFSWLIIWIGTYYGFKVRGGAEEVGKETTNSVVTGIFIVILADAAFSFILP